MYETASTHGGLCLSGPLLRFEKCLTLFGKPEAAVGRRAIFVVLLGWVPLVLLAAAQGHTRQLLLDFSVTGRYVIAALVLVLAEPFCIAQLERVAQHLFVSGLVRPADQARSGAAGATCARWLCSPWVEVGLIVGGYVLAVFLTLQVAPERYPSWRMPGYPESTAFSAAGWWQVLVSHPLLVILAVGWLWRALLWAWFLLRMARLDLQFIPAHPDRAGGALFLGFGVRAFAPASLALGVMLAGPILNEVVHRNAPLTSFQFVPLGLLVCVIVLFVGPLLLFAIPMLRAKQWGIFEYGATATGLGRQFEQRWIGTRRSEGEGTLEAPDFSAAIDLYSVVRNVTEMRTLPVDMSSLIVLVVLTLLPFVPVILAGMPLDRIVKFATNLLF